MSVIWKGFDLFNSQINKSDILKMSQYFPNLSTHFGGKVELDLSNYTIKYEVEKAAGTDASTFAKKS